MEELNNLGGEILSVFSEDVIITSLNVLLTQELHSVVQVKQTTILVKRVLRRCNIKFCHVEH